MEIPPWENIMHINELLTIVCGHGASDLHLKVGNHPIARIRGKLTPMPQFKRLVQEDTIAMAFAIMGSEKQKAKFKESFDLDLSYSIPSLGRFRCNIFNQRGTVGLVLRVIPQKIYSIDDLMLPKVLKSICNEQRGLVLVTGTTGSGKSTTLAAMIDLINSTRSAHILTIEDPIEYLHRDNLSIVNQREVDADCISFSTALRAALRQDPDVILLGEMRDLETMETALNAAETGHLVFSTLHTLDATETINRVISVFPPHHQKQIRLQLASVLRGIISQRLVPRSDGHGRVPAVEVLVATESVRACIEDKDRTKMLKDVIACGTAQYGMQTFDQSLYFLLRQGLITEDEALLWATNVGEFTLRLEGVLATSDQAKASMERGMSIAQGVGREGGSKSTRPSQPTPPVLIPAPTTPMPPIPNVKIALAR